MTSNPATQRFIYSFKYDYHHDDLCKLESRQIFGQQENNRLLFSEIKVDPSISPFIKTRFDIITFSNDYSVLLEKIRAQNIHAEGFKAEYLILDGDPEEKPERRKRLMDVGHCIEGEPDFVNPTITYSICHYENVWYFGELITQRSEWLKHNNKPCSFSNSIGMKIAKTLVSIAAQGNKDRKLLDACCGVGTIMLEAGISGITIDGCDINEKTIDKARINLAHYNYQAKLFCSDIKDVHGHYDAAIIDLPYDLYTYSTDSITTNIIESTAKLADRIIIVSIKDVEATIKESGLKILDFGSVEKRGYSKFTRKIWVCERDSKELLK